MAAPESASSDSATLIQAALYNYLRKEDWGHKAAKALLKKNKLLAEVQTDFSLGPLFGAIKAELDAEREKRLAVLPTPPAPLPTGPPVKSGPLRRLDVEYWSSKVKVKDNSYSAKAGDAYVARAADELGKVRGKNFKSEKNKKKRASWRGSGNIDTQTHSVFFESD